MNPFRRDIFARSHPGLALAYFTGVIVVTMAVASPVFAGISLAGAALGALATWGRAALPGLGASLVLVAFVAAVNPLFNTAGSTVLLSVVGRPYTAEAFLFGAVLGTQLAAALLWFSAAGRVLTPEKVTYLFGGIAPALACVLTLVARPGPADWGPARAGGAARGALGCGPAGACGAVGKARAGATVLAALTAWSLEQGVTTADSLAARGFGTGRRTPWGRYRLTARAGVAVVALVALAAVVGVGLAAGAGWVQLLPQFALPAASPLVVAGWAAWAGLVIAPTLVGAGEEALWRCSLSTR